jgi:hypothetical protein
MNKLAAELIRTGRLVVDRTGLTGRFDNRARQTRGRMVKKLERAETMGYVPTRPAAGRRIEGRRSKAMTAQGIRFSVAFPASPE